MTETLRVSKGDTTPFKWTVKDALGTARPVNGGTVKLRVGRIGNPHAKFENAMDFDGTEGAAGDGTDGKVIYSPEATDFDTPGYYDAEIRVEFSDKTVCANQFTIHVLPTINEEAT